MSYSLENNMTIIPAFIYIQVYMNTCIYNPTFHAHQFWKEYDNFFKCIPFQ